jgi:hypothetical protein
MGVRAILRRRWVAYALPAVLAIVATLLWRLFSFDRGDGLLGFTIPATVGSFLGAGAGLLILLFARVKGRERRGVPGLSAPAWGVIAVGLLVGFPLANALTSLVMCPHGECKGPSGWVFWALIAIPPLVIGYKASETGNSLMMVVLVVSAMETIGLVLAEVLALALRLDSSSSSTWQEIAVMLGVFFAAAGVFVVLGWATSWAKSVNRRAGTVRASRPTIWQASRGGAAADGRQTRRARVVAFLVIGLVVGVAFVLPGTFSCNARGNGTTYMVDHPPGGVCTRQSVSAVFSVRSVRSVTTIGDHHLFERISLVALGFPFAALIFSMSNSRELVPLGEKRPYRAGARKTFLMFTVAYAAVMLAGGYLASHAPCTTPFSPWCSERLVAIAIQGTFLAPPAIVALIGARRRLLFSDRLLAISLGEGVGVALGGLGFHIATWQGNLFLVRWTMIEWLVAAVIVAALASCAGWFLGWFSLAVRGRLEKSSLAVGTSH